MTNTYKILAAPFLIALFIIMFSAPVFAQKQMGEKGGIFDLPAHEKNDSLDAAMTHPILNMTPDKSELIKLEQDAASVIVGNPNHVNVMLDTPDTLVVIPRTPGASYFTVVGKDGSTLMQRHVVVSGSKENYVRIRRSCGNSTSGRPCEETSVYFCPDSCHEVSLNGTEASSRRR